jgi:hypothetical protein
VRYAINDINLQQTGQAEMMYKRRAGYQAAFAYQRLGVYLGKPSKSYRISPIGGKFKNPLP